jgi:ATP-binding cassette subfamily C protein CydCD
VRDPRPGSPLAGFGGRSLRGLYGLGVISGLKAATLVVIAEAIARGLGALIGGTGEWVTPMLWGISAAVARGGLTWLGRSYAVRASLGAKEDIRSRLSDRILARGGSRVGSTTILATRGLDDLDAYFRTVLPALTNVAVIPLLVGARILFADWLSAVIIVLTVALVPVFMALVGMHTGDRVRAATSALARLSDHMVELAQGLPVLVGLGRVQQQTEALRTISEEHRRTTMLSLRIAFLSSLVLELLSTISVAIVAVSIGFRLVSGTLSLEVALVVLILAPECFAPFRDLGAAFHASRSGLDALARARELIEEPVPTSPLLPGGAVTAHTLSAAFQGRSSVAFEPVDFTLEAGRITALTGASGSGKSTLLAILAGQIVNGVDGVTVTGSVTGVDPDRVAWMPQRPHTVGSTVRDELLIYADGLADADTHIDALLTTLGIAPQACSDPARLSPGELRRVAFARALLRVECGADLLLLDEPTAHLDADSATTVRRMIAALDGRVTILLASHEADIVGLSARQVRLGGATGFRESAPAGRARALASTSSGAFGSPRSSRDALADFIRPVAWRYVGAVLLGALASLFAVALTAVSGWLIVRASQHPDIMYLMVAIVGVRFFGIGRATLRYAERLVTHDAVFRSVTTLRLRLWSSLAARSSTSRALLGGGAVLDYLVAAVDEIRDLVPRIMVPLGVGALTSAAGVITIGLLHPAAVPLFLTCLVLCLIVAPAVALAADGSASTAEQVIRSTVVTRFAAAVAAAGDLSGNGVSPGVRADLAHRDEVAGHAARRSSWATGLATGIVMFACTATGIGMLAVSASAVRAGTLPPEVVAVLVLLPLALVESLAGFVEAVSLLPRLRGALRRTSSPTIAREPSGLVHVHSIHSIALVGLGARWAPDAPQVFAGLNAEVDRTHWLVVEGPSGAGKSTMIAVLLTALTPASGRLLINGVDAGELDPGTLRRRIAWCPQDGHLFASTLRANLTIACDPGERPDDANLLAVLHRVGLGRFVDSLSAGLDTDVGAGGSSVSDGERQRIVVARTLLTTADVVLLDEPTANLDADAAAVLMADLREALAGRLVVLVTHHSDERTLGDRVLRLDGLRLDGLRLDVPKRDGLTLDGSRMTLLASA